MVKTPSPLHAKRIPKSVSTRTSSADAPAVAESAVAPPAKKARPAPSNVTFL